MRALALLAPLFALLLACEPAELYSDGTRPVNPPPPMVDAGMGWDSGPQIDAGDGVGCIPSCSGRDCGDDGCGGVCGTCGEGTACSPAGTCEPTETGCTPSCAGRQCGDDGCGGSCGACMSGELCQAGTCEPTTPPPPTATCDGPRGRNVGDTIPSAEFFDCDGNPVSLDYLCGYDAAWVYSFKPWCGICRNEMRTVNAWAASQPENFEMVVVVTSNTEHGAPDAAYCNQIRSEFGLNDVRLLFDPDNRFLSTFFYGGAGAEMLYNRGVLVQKGGVSRSQAESYL